MKRFLKSITKIKVRITVYLTIIFILALYLFYHIDNIRFHNIQKIRFYLDKDIELVDFEKVRSIISLDNSTETRLLIIKKKPYLSMDGFPNILLENSNSRILKSGNLHPSQNLALFSLGYLSSYFTEQFKNKSLTKTEVELLEKIYLFINQEIVNPFSRNGISVNDHVISERIQFLAIFSSYIKENYPEKRVLIKALCKDINICMGFLIKDKYFTWQTNHGIMQLRSLAQIAGAVKNDNIRHNIIALFNERLTEVIPYFLGPDGAVYESASGYWIYIYNQLEKITKIKVVENEPSVVLLKSKLEKVESFLVTVSANDGFMQGMGDSYSILQKSKTKRIPKSKNRYFRFSNNIFGASWNDTSISYNILFASLYTPPNVHKLPEDLAIYLYINGAFFANTGTYSYNRSIERLLFQTELPHSSVTSKHHQYEEAIESGILEITEDSTMKSIIAKGFKRYRNNDTIFRSVEILAGNFLKILDHSNQVDTLTTFYNLHPDVICDQITEVKVQLTNKNNVQVKMNCNNVFQIEEGIISEKTQEITQIERIKIKGNPIAIEITLPKSNSSYKLYSSTGIDTEQSRTTQSKTLLAKYKKSNLDYLELLIEQCKLILLLFITIVISIELIIKIKKKSNL